MDNMLQCLCTVDEKKCLEAFIFVPLTILPFVLLSPTIM